MKKAMVTIFSCLFCLISQAQVAEFLSLRSAAARRDSTDDFVQVKTWLVREIHIKFDLTRQKVQFFSKGFLDRDPLVLMKDISVLSRTASPHPDNGNMVNDFSGIDKAGRTCTLTLKLANDEYRIQEGELRVEYTDHTEIYKVRAVKQDPTFLQPAR